MTDDRTDRVPAEWSPNYLSVVPYHLPAVAFQIFFKGFFIPTTFIH